ncbi:MAG: hypothetical protein IKN38_04735 [Clostridia bacterium]|nr:hypothetical protein [Clostridia bacterium]
MAEAYIFNADLNGDGRINMKDILAMTRKLSGRI